MNGTIHVELTSPCDAAGFVEFLAARGLAGSVTDTIDGCEIDVVYAVDPDERLRRDFEAALGTWLERHERPLIPACSGEHEYVIRPPGD